MGVLGSAMVLVEPVGVVERVVEPLRDLVEQIDDRLEQILTTAPAGPGRRGDRLAGERPLRHRGPRPGRPAGVLTQQPLDRLVGLAAEVARGRARAGQPPGLAARAFAGGPHPPAAAAAARLPRDACRALDGSRRRSARPGALGHRTLQSRHRSAGYRRGSPRRRPGAANVARQRCVADARAHPGRPRRGSQRWVGECTLEGGFGTVDGRVRGHAPMLPSTGSGREAPGSAWRRDRRLRSRAPNTPQNGTGAWCVRMRTGCARGRGAQPSKRQASLTRASVTFHSRGAVLAAGVGPRWRARGRSAYSRPGGSVLSHEPEREVQESAAAVDRSPDLTVLAPQRPVPVRGTGPVAGPPRLNAATVLALQRSAGNAAVTRVVARPVDRPAPRELDAPVILRYQAGDTGHGGIEQDALTRAGLSSGEAQTVYVGNWLRDLSQLPHTTAVTTIIRILSLGEFNRDTSADELGTYVPSEHLDDPRGSLDPSDPKHVGTVEDPEVRRDPVKLKAALDKLSPTQRAAYEEEERHRGNITAAAKLTHLPDYIERGKFHAKEKLREAVGLKRTPEGMRAMGDGLHAVEDYYSHSNFTEACITMLRSDPAMAPLVARMAETQLGANPALLTPVDPKTGEIQIQSGTYSPGANDWVSRLELVQSECETGQLLKAFVIGWMRMMGITAEDLGRRVGAATGRGIGGAIGGVGGGIVGGVGGALGGAASGAAAGFRRGHGFFGTIAGTVGGFFSGGAEGAVEGAQAGATAGAQALGGVGAAAGGAVGGFVGWTIGEIIGAVGLATVVPLLAIPIAAIFAAAKTGLLEKIAELEVNASGGQARARGLPGPTHSELSKDAPGNRLFDASVALAKAADEEIGRAMIAAWTATASSTGGAAPSGAALPPTPAAPSGPAPSGGGTATLAPPAPAATATAADPALAAEQERVTALVDKYVCNPAQQDWWKPIILAEARRLSSGP